MRVKTARRVEVARDVPGEPPSHEGRVPERSPDFRGEQTFGRLVAGRGGARGMSWRPAVAPDEPLGEGSVLQGHSILSRTPEAWTR